MLNGFHNISAVVNCKKPYLYAPHMRIIAIEGLTLGMGSECAHCKEQGLAKAEVIQVGCRSREAYSHERLHSGGGLGRYSV